MSETRYSPALPASRIVALDGLRGLGLLMVLVYHSLLLIGFDKIPFASLWDWIWTGLDIFFVLSGYLITRILLGAHGKANFFLNFFMRRVVRIFPAYYATLAIVFLLFPLLSDEFAHSTSRDSVAIYATYIQNWVFGIHGWPDWHALAHLWSMAVEEQFYLLWPFVILLFGPGRMAKVCIAVFAISFISKNLLYFTDILPPLFNYTSTLTRMDGIAAGALIAVLSPSYLRERKEWIVALGAAGCALLAIVIFLMHRGAGQEFVIGTLAMILISGAVVASLHAEIDRPVLTAPLSHPFLVWFGQRSYSIYLLHYPIQAVIWERLGADITVLAESAPLIVSFLVCIASIAIFTVLGLPLFYLIEKPFMRLRPKFG